MANMDLKKEIKASPAQLHYANTLFYGAVIGFVLMIVTYCLYISGIVEPLIPLEELPKLMPVETQGDDLIDFGGV